MLVVSPFLRDALERCRAAAARCDQAAARPEREAPAAAPAAPPRAVVAPAARAAAAAPSAAGATPAAAPPRENGSALRRWTREETTRLQRYRHAGWPVARIADALGRTPDAVRYHVAYLRRRGRVVAPGPRSEREPTPETTQRLKRVWEQAPSVGAAAERLGVSRKTLAKWLRRLEDDGAGLPRRPGGARGGAPSGAGSGAPSGAGSGGTAAADRSGPQRSHGAAAADRGTAQP